MSLFDVKKDELAQLRGLNDADLGKVNDLQIMMVSLLVLLGQSGADDPPLKRELRNRIIGRLR